MKDKEPTEELVVVDVSRYKKIKNALQESESRYRSLFENMPIGIFRCSADGKILDANPALLKLLGYESSTNADPKNLGKRNKNISKILVEFCKKIESKNEFRSFDLTWRKKGNTPLFISVNARMVSASDNKVLFYEGTVEDISERKQAEEALRENAMNLARSQRIGKLGSWDWDVAGNSLVWSDETYRIWGIGKDFALTFENITAMIHPDDRELNSKKVEEFLAHSNEGGFEFRIICPDGTIKHIYQNIEATRDPSNQPIRMFGIMQDITERKQAESQKKAAIEALQAALAGKEVLLKEVHHRVKNNLAAIIGLLQMQHEAVNDPAAVAQFSELEGRIRSMALVHETLYNSENLARIDLQDYLEALIAKLRAAMAPGRDVRISVAAAGVKMGLDCAIPCGLILNELLTNAFKYAFPGGRPRAGENACAIAITAAWDGNAGDNGVYTLTVADNGVGLPVDLDWATTKTLGLRLVRMLGQFQLNGRVELDRSQGTSFRLVFAARQMGEGVMHGQ